MNAPTLGEVLDGKYRIDARLGEGGFADVMRATTLSTGRQVAIKFLRPTSGGYDSSNVARFKREMRVVAQLQCPHTLTLFDFGRTAGGLLFMVFEYIEGEDLLTLINRRGTLTEPEVVWVLRQALLSLAEAHELGVLHRDLKPDNIRVFQYGDDPLRIKLLDFGIAKSLNDDDVRLTGTGNVVGTPRYMAPEQMFGAELAPSTDLYGLGLVACEMLVGRHITAFKGGPRHIEIGPETGVSTPVRRIVNRMVEPDEHDRYESALQVLAELRDLASGSSSSVAPVEQQLPPPPVRPAVPPPVERKARGVVHFAVGAGLLFGVGAAVVLLRAEPTQPVVTSVEVPSSIVKTTPGPTAPVTPATPSDMGSDSASMTADAGQRDGCGRVPPFKGLGTIHESNDFIDKNRAVYIPKNYDPKRRHASIVLLREAGQKRRHMVEAGFGALADREGLVLFAPGGGDATIDFGNVRGVLWNKPHDIMEMRQMWEHMHTVLCLDPTRVYAVGDVSGGRAVERLPCEWPVTAVATNGYNRDVAFAICDQPEPIPYIQLVFSRDQYNPKDGGPNVTGTAKRSWSEAAQHWRNLHKCGKRPRRDRATHGTCVHYDCEVAYSQCQITGGRPWPGTAPPVWEKLNGTPGGQPSEFESIDTIWNFFSSVPPLEPPGVLP